MREIEVGKLKVQLDSVLRDVENGEQVRVTRDGRPVAEVVPAAPARSEAMEKLIAEGRVTPGVRSRTRRKARPLDIGVSGTSIILAERDEER